MHLIKECKSQTDEVFTIFRMLKSYFDFFLELYKQIFGLCLLQPTSFQLLHCSCIQIFC